MVLDATLKSTVSNTNTSHVSVEFFLLDKLVDDEATVTILAQ